MVEDRIEEYLAWRRGMKEEDFVHAFQSIKALEAIKFSIATISSKQEKLDAIEEEAARWMS